MIESNSNIKEDILKKEEGVGDIKHKRGKKDILAYLPFAKMFLKEKREEGGN